MRIGFDARLINQTGVGRYIRNLLEEIKDLDMENEYYIFLTPADFDSFQIPNKYWHKIKTGIKWHSLNEQLFMPLFLSRYRLDLVHFPYFSVPVFYPGKFVLTVHDLIIDHFSTGRASTLPFFVYKLKRFFYWWIMKNTLKNASRIFAISKTTKKEIIDHYGISSDKIVITYDALDNSFFSLKNKYRPKKLFSFDYLLYVGNAYPHKNLELLCKLFSDYEIYSRVKLVLTGDDDFFYPRLKKIIKENCLEDKIIFFGKADNRQLIDLYSNARGLVIPSLMEGFGLPNLEAVYLSCLPVVSDIPIFREIWKNTLIYFNPENRQSLKKAILKLLFLRPVTLKKILNKAKQKTKQFSWKKTAELTLVHY